MKVVFWELLLSFTFFFFFKVLVSFIINALRLCNVADIEMFVAVTTGAITQGNGLKCTTHKQNLDSKITQSSLA